MGDIYRLQDPKDMASYDIAHELFEGTTYSPHDRDIAIVVLVGLANGSLFRSPTKESIAAQHELVKRAAVHLGIALTEETS